MKSKKKFNYKQIIQKIQNVRKKNNNNWMDILRISFKYSPKETLQVMKKIHSADKKISRLFTKIKI